jgi:hypothetical protein
MWPKRLIKSFSMCLVVVFPAYRSDLTLYVASKYLQLSVRIYYVPTSNMIYIYHFRLTPIRYEYASPLSASNASANVVLLRRKDVFRDWRPLQQRLVVRRRPSGTPLTASPVYACVYSLQTAPYMRSEHGTSVVRWIKNMEKFSRELDFDWFPVDQWGFEAGGPQLRVPQIELPLRVSKVITVCLLAGSVLLTRLQTNKQTNLFYFVRPSFQSREYVRGISVASRRHIPTSSSADSRPHTSRVNRSIYADRECLDGRDARP